MGWYLLRRLFWSLGVLGLISFVVFLVLNVLPGDPARLVVGIEASPELYREVRAELGLDRPWPLRYLNWIAGAFRGELGRSLRYRVPVGELLGRALAVTLPLAGLAAVLSLVIALPVGVAAAVRPGGALDLALMGGVQLGMALPEFWLGFLLIGAFSLELGALPAGGFPGWGRAGAALSHLVLPALALAIPRGAYLARMVRGSLLETLGQAYVAAARAKGLPEGRVVWRHALRPALVPVIAAGSVVFGRLLAGALVVENLFFLPGLGRLALTAVLARDIPVVQGTVVVAAAAIMGAGFLAELSYGALDPRIRYR